MNRTIAKVATAIGFCVFRAESALAVMPTAPAMDGVDSGDYMAYFKNYWKQLVAVLVLVLCSYGLLKIAGNVIKTYHEYTAGKAEITELFMHIGIGFLILIVMVLLLTQASDVFA